MKIIITGASGYIGSHTANNLLRRGVSPQDLILVTRDPDRLMAFAELGANVRAGDFNQPDGLAAAFAGGDRLFMIAVAPEGLETPADQARLQRAALEAAAAAGVTFAVIQSSVGTIEDPTPRDPVDVESERVLRASGMDWAILRTSAFIDSRGRDAKRLVAGGALVTNHGDGAAHYVARDDIAEAAAAVLTGEGRGGRIYNLVGQGVTAVEHADIISRLADRVVAVEQVDDDEFMRRMIARGRMARLSRTATRQGRDVRQRQTPPDCDLPDLIGRPGVSLDAFLHANREELLTGVPPVGSPARLA